MPHATANPLDVELGLEVPVPDDAAYVSDRKDGRLKVGESKTFTDRAVFTTAGESRLWVVG